LALFAVLFLIFPKLDSYQGLDLIKEYPWLDDALNIPVFFFGSVSVIMFYLTAQKALQPKEWWKEIIYLPCLLALGIGMSLNNTKAVLEAMVNYKTGFVRTPKYGIGEKKKAGWKNSNYKAIKSLMPVLEFAFGVFFALVVLYNFTEERYLTAVLLLPFPLGFFYTSLSSMAHMLPSFSKTQEPVAVEVETED